MMIEIPYNLDIFNLPDNDVEYKGFAFCLDGIQGIENIDEKFIFDGPINILSFAHPLLVTLYDQNILVSNDELKKFIKENAEGLSNISPYRTYRSSLNIIKKAIESSDKKSFLMAIRISSMIWSRYYLDNFLEARQLPDIWAERYQAALDGKIDAEILKEYLKEIENKVYEYYFRAFDDNNELCEQLETLIKSVLRGE